MGYNNQEHLGVEFVEAIAEEYIGEKITSEHSDTCGGCSECER